MSSYTDCCESADFDENIPFCKSTRREMIQNEPERALNASLDSGIIPLQYPDISPVNADIYKETENNALLNISDIEIRHEENVIWKDSFKPFNYHADTNKYFKSKNSPYKVKNSSQQKSATKNTKNNVHEIAEGSCSQVESSDLSIPNEDYEYAIEEVPESPDTYVKEISVVDQTFMPTGHKNTNSDSKLPSPRKPSPKIVKHMVGSRNKLLISKISPLKTYDNRVQNRRSPQNTNSKTNKSNREVPNFFPDKFRMPNEVKDMIFGGPRRVVSPKRAEQIGSRLHKGMSNGGRSLERKTHNMNYIKQQRLKSEERILNNR